MTLILETLRIFVQLLETLIIVRVFLRIFRVSPNASIGRIIYEMTEPLLIPARAILDKLGLNKGFFDFSPWIAIMLINIVYSILIRILV